MEYEGQVIREPFPGGCQFMTDEEARRAVKGIRAHFVRFKLGVNRKNDVTHHQNVEIWDMRIGSKPSAMSAEEWAQYKSRTPIDQCPEFDEYTDICLDEFVYLVKLDVDWRQWPADDFQRDPNAYYKQVTPSMEKFFQEPPPSVAESFPKEA